MEIANLVLEYLKATLWPGVVVLAVLLFRAPIAAWIKNLESFKGEAWGLKFEGTGHTSAETVANLDRAGKVNPSIRAALMPAASAAPMPTRADYAQASIEALAKESSSDPNVKLFLGVFQDSTETVKSALEAGANVNITDTELLTKYRAQLEKPSTRMQIDERAREIARQRAASIQTKERPS